MTIKVTVPNTSSDSLTFGSANTPTAAQVVGIDSGSSNGQLAFNTTASGTSTERMRIDSSGQLHTKDGAGNIKPDYGCRAWVNFNGTGTVAIRASGNVSSITDNGTGYYTVNFTTAMSDANYSICTAGSNATGSNLWVVIGDGNVAPTTSAFQIRSFNSTVTAVDGEYIRASVFR